ncbi:Predicted membrane protein [Streptococcus pyogenes]|uniref:DUF2335 domain-containing protein n=1 Tax=Streptococcus canis TaxID=1329 RepID=A0AAE4TRC0_STRCB|nr:MULTISPECIES: DUF2335 domain-containing protein [Streptococcus]MDV5976788.1 DUF2335 domain-containing protein [Streptococcus canis]VGZ83174.1 Predicted membrane protein [Streptococcus pyogenes]VTS48929.1 Predicted membrane protein [Streptococcus dysgalactiae subsp. equisimilis]VTS50062.1 Predicted membrane protein [Streptococcus dysgalactiae subsp. equisimilis]
MSKKSSEILDVNDIVEKVEKLPQAEREVVFEKLEIYKGDLPHPETLKGYNSLYPEAAKKIIDNGIAESEHRRKMENKYIENNSKSYRLGQILGFIIALSIVGCGTFLIFTGNQISGSLMTGATALGVIGLFTGQNKK